MKKKTALHIPRCYLLWAEIVLSFTKGIDFYLQNGVVNQVFIELILENLETAGPIDILHAFNWQYTLNCIKAYFCVDYIANNAQNSVDFTLIRIFEIQNQGISDIQLQEASPYSEYAVKSLGERKVPLAIPGVCETSTWIAGVMSNIVYSDINFDAKRFLETRSSLVRYALRTHHIKTNGTIVYNPTNPFGDKIHLFDVLCEK